MRQVDEQSDHVVEQKEKEKRKRIEQLQELLKPIKNARGCDFVLLHNSAGFPMTFLPALEEAKLEIAEMGNHLSSFFEQLQQFQKKIKAESTQFIELQFADKIILSNAVADKDAWVTVIGEENLNVGFIRMELRKLVKQVQPLIG
jgi:predicted regulator of Ras-like GTPase activity (Roadblock/LC7/MglB family)